MVKSPIPKPERHQIMKILLAKLGTQQCTRKELIVEVLDQLPDTRVTSITRMLKYLEEQDYINSPTDRVYVLADS